MDKQYTARELIETSRDLLIAQGSWATRLGKTGIYKGCLMCAYLNDEGHKCAIGILPEFPADKQELQQAVWALDLPFLSKLPVHTLTDVQRHLHDWPATLKHYTTPEEAEAHTKGFQMEEPNPFNADHVRAAADFLLKRYCPEEVQAQ